MLSIDRKSWKTLDEPRMKHLRIHVCVRRFSAQWQVFDRKINFLVLTGFFFFFNIYWHLNVHISRKRKELIKNNNNFSWNRHIKVRHFKNLDPRQIIWFFFLEMSWQLRLIFYPEFYSTIRDDLSWREILLTIT